MRTVEIQPRLRFGWPWRHWLLFAIVCCALVVISAVVTPVINQYRQLAHIEDQLAQALELEGRLASGDLWHDLTPLTNPMAIAISQQALAEAERLVAGNPTNVIILQQWGRLAMLAGQPETAITAFSAATAYQPDSPLLWWQLGMAYERLAAPVELDATAEPALEWVSPPPSARVWSLWPAMLGQSNWWAPAEPIRRPLALADRLELRATLPATTTNLIFWPVRLTAEPTTYQVLVNNQPVTLNLSTVTGVSAAWQPALIDLSLWAGQTVALTLVSDQPMGWGEVQLVTAADTRCALVMCRQRAAAAWKEGGFTADDFLRLGSRAFHQQQFREALVWYNRAAIMGTDLASAMWYVRHRATDDRAALARSVTIDHGWLDDSFQLWAWMQWGLTLIEEQSLLEAEQAFRYAVAISEQHQMADRYRSEAYRHLGIALWRQGDLDAALSAMSKALELNPRSVWANIHYGKVLYLADSTQRAAVEQVFATALSLNPDPAIWQNLIGFWRWVGEPVQVAALCAQARQAGVDMTALTECNQ